MVAKPDLEKLLRVVRAEYLEMPGLRLSLAQAQRLWNLDRRSCEWLLTALVERGFLYRSLDAKYVWTGSDTPRLVAAGQGQGGGLGVAARS